MHFGEITVEDCFCIPSGISHKMEWFKKLPFNKAVSLDDGRIEHFVDNATIWLHEFVEYGDKNDTDVN